MVLWVYGQVPMTIAVTSESATTSVLRQPGRRLEAQRQEQGRALTLTCDEAGGGGAPGGGDAGNAELGGDALGGLLAAVADNHDLHAVDCLQQLWQTRGPNELPYGQQGVSAGAGAGAEGGDRMSADERRETYRDVELGGVAARADDAYLDGHGVVVGSWRAYIRVKRRRTAGSAASASTVSIRLLLRA